MLEKLRHRGAEEEGFTLVELLVVMLILGILAAIAIPAFFSQRDKGYDADAKANVRTMQTAIETYASDNGGSYLGATETNLAVIEGTVNEIAGDVALTPAPGAETYTVVGTSDSGGTFSLTRTNSGDLTYVCAPVSSGSCPSSGDWGG